jgi:ribosomal protein L37AE/L43A
MKIRIRYYQVECEECPQVRDTKSEILVCKGCQIVTAIVSYAKVLIPALIDNDVNSIINVYC